MSTNYDYQETVYDSEKTVEQLAKRLTKQQFKALCDTGISMINDIGEPVTGQCVYDLYNQFCKDI